MNRSRARSLRWVIAFTAAVYVQAAHAQVVPDYVLTGDGGSKFGFSVSSAGDVNNDNHEDILVGAPFYLPGDQGAIVVYSGATGILMYLRSGSTLGEQFGTSVAGGADITGDGLDDVLVGAPFLDTGGADRGLIAIYGGPGFTKIGGLFGAYPGDQFGYSVDYAGDVNLDGTADILVGSPASDSFAFNAGLVEVFSGLTGTLLRVHGGAAGDQLGWSVHGAGHVNLDSNADYAASAPYSNAAGDSAGRVIVYSGVNGATLYNLLGLSAGDLFGYAFAAGADLGNAGFTGDDLFIGAPLRDHFATDAGSVTTYFGETGLGGGTIFGPSVGWFGSAVDRAGDLNLNGDDEIWTAAPYADNFGVDAGLVWGLPMEFFQGGEHPGDLYGFSIATADLSGDGLDDLIVGAPGYPAGLDSGRVYVYIMKDNDSDLIIDRLDNCPATYNPGQEDTDGDSLGNACDVGDTLVFTLLSPVDMVVTDPAGDSIGLGFNTILLGSAYDTLSDVNNDLESDDQVTIPNPIAGPYNVRIIPEFDANPSDQFTLTIRINGNQLFLPDDYADQTVSALGNTIPETYVWNASTTFAGDANANGVTNSSDIIYLVNYVFKGGPNTVVPGHGDVNCDGAVTSADIIRLVNYVFKSGAAPCSNTAGG